MANKPDKGSVEQKLTSFRDRLGISEQTFAQLTADGKDGGRLIDLFEKMHAADAGSRNWDGLRFTLAELAGPIAFVIVAIILLACITFMHDGPDRDKTISDTVHTMTGALVGAFAGYFGARKKKG